MAGLPLARYRVLDFGTVVAGPMAAQLLADMGAEVIKIESRQKLDLLRMGRPVVGDDIAGGDEGKWPDLQPTFHAVNRNKLSLTVDMKHPQGLDLLKRLAAVSDVVLENFSPGVMARAGLDYPSLRATNPTIIMVSLSGAGAYGPLSNMLTYATVVSALSGLSALIGYPGERVLGMTQAAYPDITGAITGAVAALIALYHRQRTGRGQFVDVSQWEAGLALCGEAMLEYAMTGRVPKPTGNDHRLMAPHGNYPCAGEDKWVSIAVKTEEEWRALCGVMGNPAWTHQSPFADLASRLAHRRELDRHIAEWTAQRTPAEVVTALQGVTVAATQVMNQEDLYFDPHLAARGTYVEVEQPLVGREPIYGIPWRLSGTPGAVQRPAPTLGQHNTQVLRELLGYATEAAEQLAAAGALA